MKKYFLMVFSFILAFALTGCASNEKSESEVTTEEAQQNEQPEQTIENDEEAIERLLKEFGAKLQHVSLQAPQDEVKKSMQEHYRDFVSEVLLEEWMENPFKAPGRQTSSPWPDRIEIESIEKISEDAYEVKAYIIEVSSADLANDGFSSIVGITLLVQKTDGEWKIDNVFMGGRSDKMPSAESEDTHGHDTPSAEDGEQQGHETPQAKDGEPHGHDK